MDRQVKEPSEVLSEFLSYIDRIRYDYKTAHDAVKKEEKRLQDLLHELEFAEGENKKRRAGTKLQQSRRNRRRQKDEMMRLELVVHFLMIRLQKVRLIRCGSFSGNRESRKSFWTGSGIIIREQENSRTNERRA